MRHSSGRKIPPAFYALTAALLFGASTPAAKLLLAETSPQLLAGLLYFGSGLGLSLYSLVVGRKQANQQWIVMRSRDIFWLTLAIAAGGVAAPLVLMLGLTTTPAASASLLLNLEGVFTAFIAWFAFKEHTDRQIVLGMFVIVAGSLLLSWAPGQSLSFSFGSLAIVAACFCWALDNNFTRNVSDAGPAQVAAIKGLIAGSFNCFLALATGSKLPAMGIVFLSMTIGLLAYGISLTMFIKALRLLGTARTCAYFSTAPFAGAILSLVFLKEPVTLNLAIAGALMTLGVVLHLTEKHEHEHIHEGQEHAHMHTHDEHHHHEHSADDPPGQPHSHRHVHALLRHSHPHFPDTEHRHEHDTDE